MGALRLVVVPVALLASTVALAQHGRTVEEASTVSARGPIPPMTKSEPFSTSADVVFSLARRWELGLSAEVLGSADPALSAEADRGSYSGMAWTMARF